MYEYSAGRHWSLDWMEENQTATYFLRSRLFTYDIMKNVNAHVRNCLLNPENAHMAQTKTLTDPTRKRHKKEDSASFV
jgi:hypothetical protein